MDAFAAIFVCYTVIACGIFVLTHEGQGVSAAIGLALCWPAIATVLSIGVFAGFLSARAEKKETER